MDRRFSLLIVNNALRLKKKRLSITDKTGSTRITMLPEVGRTKMYRKKMCSREVGGSETGEEDFFSVPGSCFRGRTPRTLDAMLPYGALCERR